MANTTFELRGTHDSRGLLRKRKRARKQTRADHFENVFHLFRFTRNLYRLVGTKVNVFDIQSLLFFCTLDGSSKI